MIPSEAAFGGYAETIIKDPEEYDCLEVHGVVEEPDGSGGTVCEVNDETPQFFSVYAHLKLGSVNCIGDFHTREDALAYAESVSNKYNWPVHTF
ncbi:hypothetical protein [Edaphobacter dinghuensis]|uniref:Uncharacterized protein n=1 Tax=Edaphobacter dinghuensis TaxID=1560005 RepID=A0A917HPY9_9BACT|nr:hypothetical protein [Edaphobacter dinghuensis]GGG86666.1 hypothetical protein GCM10011585_33300 [Edaphobacter dinghuensis]